MDYLIAEAVYLRVQHEDAQARKEADRQAKIEQKRQEAEQALNAFR